MSKSSVMDAADLSPGADHRHGGGDARASRRRPRDTHERRVALMPR